MPKLTKAQMMKRLRDERRAEGLRKLPDKYVNKEFFDTYNEQVDKTIKLLNERYNCFIFDTGE